MKILYLSPGCFDKGGISRYNRYQISALRELNEINQLKVFTIHPRSADDFEETFEVDYVGHGIGILSKINFFLQAFRLTLGWRPDLVWVGHVNLSGMGFLLARLVRAKLFLNTYGLEVWSGLRIDAAFGLRHADVVISDCHFTARYLEENGFRAQNSVYVIWDCIDLKKFHPEEPRVNNNVLRKYGLPDPLAFPWVLTLGRLSKGAMHKGYDRLISVFAEVAEVEPSVVLVIAGKGDMLESLKAMVRKTGFESRVFFTGMVHEHDLPALYRMGTFFSLVSDRGIGRGEGIPLTPLEAMACGVPIIVGNEDGSQEAVIGEENGFVINPHNLAEHKRIILKMLTDSQSRVQMQKGAALIAKQFFSYPVFLEKHRQLLHSKTQKENG